MKCRVLCVLWEQPNPAVTIVVRVVRSVKHTCILYPRLGAKNLAMSSVITVSGEMLQKTLAEQATVVIQKNREALRMHKAKIAQATALLAMSLDPSTTFDITETSVKVHMTTSSTDSTDSSTDNSDSSKNTQALWRGCISTWPYSSVLSYRWGGGRVIND